MFRLESTSSLPCRRNECTGQLASSACMAVILLSKSRWILWRRHYLAKCFSDALILQALFWIVNINNCRGEVTSDFCVADASVRLLWSLFILYQKKRLHDQSIPNVLIPKLILKTKSPKLTDVWAETNSLLIGCTAVILSSNMINTLFGYFDPDFIF